MRSSGFIHALNELEWIESEPRAGSAVRSLAVNVSPVIGTDVSSLGPWAPFAKIYVIIIYF